MEGNPVFGVDTPGVAVPSPRGVSITLLVSSDTIGGEISTKPPKTSSVLSVLSSSVFVAHLYQRKGIYYIEISHFITAR